MVRRTLTTAVLVLGISALASARDLYRVEVRGARPLLARDQPVSRGSVLVFHRHPDGRLVGVPQELVANVGPASPANVEVPRASGRGSHIRLSQSRVHASAADLADEAVVTPMSGSGPVRPLEPGEAIVIGPTGSGAPSIGSAAGQMVGSGGNAAQVSAARQAVESQVFPGDLTTPVGPSNGGSGNSNMATGIYGAGAGTAPATQPVLNPTLTSALGTNPINPNGFPATTVNGPQSGTNPIGPNGFPVTTTGTPQPGAAQPVQGNTTPRTTSSARVTGTGNDLIVVPANGGSSMITNTGSQGTRTQAKTGTTGKAPAGASKQ
jgi:hypothetical protein